MGSRALRSSVVSASVIALLLGGSPGVHATTPPSLRMIPTLDALSVKARSRGGIGLDLGVWIASAGGDFQVRVSRPDYLTDLSAVQTTSRGSVLRQIPLQDIDSWYGFARFLHFSVEDATGHTVYQSLQDFCPNGWDEDRVDDSGPMNPTYPQWCGAGPFTLGTVWGIDQGWAVNPFMWLWVPARLLPAGSYDVHVWIDPTFTDLFQIAPADSEARIALTVTAASTSTRERSTAGPAVAPSAPTRSGGTSAAATETVQLSDVPEIVPPDTAVPDLAALPAWGIGVMSRHGRDYLTFGSTAWNAGPSPMIVEGYRLADEAVMNAWQYFTNSSGKIIGKAPVGQLAYDARRGHQHWHFQQFALYTLTDSTRTEVVRSDKASYCLAPTDPIDLLADRAEWVPYQTGFFSACGEPSSLWVRESLPVGWGDTYFQWLPGQSFNITDLPNGRYYIRIQVNPLGALFDRTAADDVSYRRIRLTGEPGDRGVVVPPYEGIDTEGCFGCFVAPGQPPWDGFPNWPPA